MGHFNMPRTRDNVMEPRITVGLTFALYSAIS